MSGEKVEIHYRRVPDRVEIFRQVVLERSADCIVTFVEAAAIDRPVRAGATIVLEPGAPVIWFTYPGLWYDIGRFHLRDGTHTGDYANILTPVSIDGARWDTTDLCLDVWAGADGEVLLLDEADFAAAVTAGWIDRTIAQTARETAESIVRLAADGAWPPDHVRDWTLSRARVRLEEIRSA